MRRLATRVFLLVGIVLATMVFLISLTSADGPGKNPVFITYEEAEALGREILSEALKAVSGLRVALTGELDALKTQVEVLEDEVASLTAT